MKWAILIFSALLLSGCGSIDKRKFPDAEPSLMVECQDLSKLPEDPVTISQLMTVVVQNYTLYYQCANKTKSWQEWYEKQKKNYQGKVTGGENEKNTN